MGNENDMKRTVSARQVTSFIWFYWRRQGFWFALLMVGLVVNVAIDIMFPVVSGYLVDTISTAGRSTDCRSDRHDGLGCHPVCGAKRCFLYRPAPEVPALDALRRPGDARHHHGRVCARTTATRRTGMRVPMPGPRCGNSPAACGLMTPSADTVYAALLPAALMLVGILVVLAWRWPLVGLYAGVTSAFYVGVTAWLAIRHLPSRHRAHMDADSEVGAQVADAITCNSVVKSFGTEAREDARLLSLADFCGARQWAPGR